MTDKPLNLVHYVPGIRLAQGGVVRAILDSSAVLSARGHRITVIVYAPEDIPPTWFAGESANPRAIVLPEPTLPGRPLSRAALKLAEPAIAQADVLHLHAPWLDGNRQLASIARRHNVPYLVTTHGFLNDWAMQQQPLKKKIYMTLFGRRLLSNAAMIHCSAPAELDQAKKWFTNPHTITLPLLTDLTPFQNLPGPDEALNLLLPHQRTQPKLLLLSRLHEKKGIDILLRATASLRDQNKSFLVLIAGTGEPTYEKMLHDLTTQLNLNDRVLFLGLITGPKKLSLYQSADLFVLPTLQENFGLVLTESLACGTPVLTTRGTDIWPQLQEAGGIITDATPTAIAAAINDLLSKPAGLKPLGQRGRDWVFKTLAPEPLAQRYEQLYRNLK